MVKESRKINYSGYTVKAGDIWDPKRGKFSARQINPVPHGANPKTRPIWRVSSLLLALRPDSGASRSHSLDTPHSLDSDQYDA